MKNKTNLNKIIILFCCSLYLFGCRTVPTEESVSKDLTPMEIKQLAQEEIDAGKKKNALAYYNILLTRYGSDMSVRVAAEFEIAHIYIEQKKWIVADDMLKRIIARYETMGGASLPPKYYILAQNDYKKTQKKLETKTKKAETKEN